MRIRRHGHLKSLLNQDLLRRIGEMFFAADYMAYLHLKVVNHHAEIIQWHAFILGNSDIPHQSTIKRNVAADNIFKRNLLFWHFESDDGAFSSLFSFPSFFYPNVAAFTGITRCLPAQKHFLASHFQFFFAAETIIRQVFLEQRIHKIRIPFCSLGLAIRTEVPDIIFGFRFSLDLPSTLRFSTVRSSTLRLGLEDFRPNRLRLEEFGLEDWPFIPKN